MGVFKDVGQSLTTALFGIVLFGVSLFVLGWNEKRSVWTAQTIGYARDEYVQLNSCIPDPANNNKLIALEGCEATPLGGNVTTAEYLANMPYSSPYGDLSNTNEVVFSWRRTSEQRVLHETESDKKYSYDERWQSSAEKYSNPDMSFSPPSWPSYFNSYSRVASNICIGSSNCTGQGQNSFVLDTTSSWGNGEGSKIGALTQLILNPYFNTTFSGFNSMGYCNGYAQTKLGYTCNPRAASGGYQQVQGDFRVSWNQRVKQPGATVSALARQVQRGSVIGFEQWQNPHHSSCSYCKIGKFVNGDMSGDDILDELESENKALTWVLRFVGWLLCWMSMLFMCTPIMTVAENAAKVASYIPFFPNFGWMAEAIVEAMECIIASITCVLATCVSLLVIGIAWLMYRPAIGVPLVCVCVGGCIGTWIAMDRMRRKNAGSNYGERQPLGVQGETEV